MYIIYIYIYIYISRLGQTRRDAGSLGKRKKGDGKRWTAHFSHLRSLLSQTLSLTR